MRRLHLVVGTAAVVLFLITGQLMRHHTPPMGALSDSARLLYRSRHIYILTAGLVNVILGLYMDRQFSGWRKAVQYIGSALLLLSAAILALAFAVEPERGFRAQMPWSSFGLYSVLAGCSLHFLSAAAASRKGDRSDGINSAALRSASSSS